MSVVVYDLFRFLSYPAFKIATEHIEVSIVLLRNTSSNGDRPTNTNNRRNVYNVTLYYEQVDFVESHLSPVVKLTISTKVLFILSSLLIYACTLKGVSERSETILNDTIKV